MNPMPDTLLKRMPYAIVIDEKCILKFLYGIFNIFYYTMRYMLWEINCFFFGIL